MQTVTFVFSGQFEPASFTDLPATARRGSRLTPAHRSSVPTASASQSQARTTLVDAFEVACSLGPIDCMVDDIVRYPGDHPDLGGGAVMTQQPGWYPVALAGGVETEPRPGRTSSARRSSSGVTRLERRTSGKIAVLTAACG